jgi:hypothetical protein
VTEAEAPKSLFERITFPAANPAVPVTEAPATPIKSIFDRIIFPAATPAATEAPSFGNSLFGRIKLPAAAPEAEQEQQLSTNHSLIPTAEATTLPQTSDTGVVDYKSIIPFHVPIPSSSIFTSTTPVFPTSAAPTAPAAPFNATNFRLPSTFPNVDDSGYGSFLGGAGNSNGFSNTFNYNDFGWLGYSSYPPSPTLPSFSLPYSPTSPSFPLPEVEDEMSKLELSDSEESAVSALEQLYVPREKGGFTGVKGYWAMGLTFGDVVGPAKRKWEETEAQIEGQVKRRITRRYGWRK